MLHGAGILTYIYPKNGPNVGKYSMEHLGILEASLASGGPKPGARKPWENMGKYGKP